MMLKKLFITATVSLLLSLTLLARTEGDSSFSETPVVLHTATGDIFGTLTLPLKQGKPAVALIIAGSGPTDRNGNNPMMKNESLRMLAYSLADSNIATLRYDKRAIGESEGAAKTEADLRFEDYVSDAKGWIEMLKNDNRFSRVFVIGHSEGSLIGMIAAQGLADGFVSIAGAGNSADKTIKQQLASQPQAVIDMCYPIIDSLVAGKTVSNVNPALYSLFRPSVQPYMISWFKYDPAIEINKLTMPILIVQGTNDLQVTAEDAKLLAGANKQARIEMIQDMNHVFRVVVQGDRDANIAAYKDPSLPISSEMIKGIAGFIHSVR